MKDIVLMSVSFTHLGVYLLLLIGATWVLTASSILSPVRMWLGLAKWPLSFLGALLYCRMCTAFWLGVASVGFNPLLTHVSPLTASCSGLIAVAVMVITYPLLPAMDNSDEWVLVQEVRDLREKANAEENFNV